MFGYFHLFSPSSPLWRDLLIAVSVLAQSQKRIRFLLFVCHTGSLQTFSAGKVTQRVRNKRASCAWVRRQPPDPDFSRYHGSMIDDSMAGDPRSVVFDEGFSVPYLLGKRRGCVALSSTGQ